MDNDYIQLPVNGIDYSEIRRNLVSFLQGQTNKDGSPVYADYDFAASGISTLLNLLAYHGHYIGYYVKMLLNESFTDSSVKKESMYSKAKLTGYTPKGKRCSRIDVQLKLEFDLENVNEPPSRNVLVSKGTSFSGANREQDNRLFYLIDDVIIKDVEYSTRIVENVSRNYATYTSEPFTIYEGKKLEWKFRVDYTLLNQRYPIKDKNIDIDTLRVVVLPEGSEKGEEYHLSNDVFSVDGTSPVYYISTQEEGNYEIIFGNGIFGKKPQNRSIIYCTYISSNGESGNGCRTFSFNAPSSGASGIFDNATVILKAGDLSSGGAEPETVDSLRFTIPHHYKRQNRILTEDDYKSLIISEFRNIESINVWGGEKNHYKNYGSVYLCIKPKYTQTLSASAKKELENLVSKYSVIGLKPIFVDPEYINVELSIYVKVNKRKTIKSLGELESQILNIVTDYNDNELNVFDNFYSEVSLMDKIRTSSLAIISCYSEKILSKDFTVLYNNEIENTLILGNPIKKGIESSKFIYGNKIVYYADDIDLNSDSNLYIFDSVTNTKLLKKSFGTVDYERGIIKFIFPKYSKVVDRSYENSGALNFRMFPIKPDIETYLQNIVRVTKTRVIMTTV